MLCKQVELYDTNDRTRMFCWLPVDKRIKPGTRLTLKELPERDWLVMRVFNTVVDNAHFNRGWNNNISRCS